MHCSQTTVSLCLVLLAAPWSRAAAASPVAVVQEEEGQLFEEALPLYEIRGIDPVDAAPKVFLALKDTSGMTARCDWVYTPPEVSVPHPTNHVLTVFQPRTPVGGERFPTIIWSGANAFQTGVPPALNPNQNTFLFEALCRGWAVVTVGTNGISSCHTSAQPGRCNFPAGVCSGTPGTFGCKDYSLWYGQDTIAGSPWNDFNYFIGEKDFRVIRNPCG